MRRREFLGWGAFSAIQMYALMGKGTSQPAVAKASGFRVGELQPQGSGLLEVAKGIRYVALQSGTDTMSDGFAAGAQPDGMAVFDGGNGAYTLLRNQELGDAGFMAKYGIALPTGLKGTWDGPHFADGRYGGVTRVVLDKAVLEAELREGIGQKSQAVRDSRWVLAGTDKNCSGGVLSGGWVTCEESSSPGHGYALFTKPEDEALTDPRPIRSWGRMHREGVALDPETGVVYMTEDRGDGLFYRHVPKRKTAPMSEGRVEALVVEGLSTLDPYPANRSPKTGTPQWQNGQEFPVRWVEIPDPQAAKETCRSQGAKLGCATFNRNEGIVWDADSVWFIASLGGCVNGGQIFQYVPDRTDPSRGKLILQYEVTDRSVLSCPDNLVMAPWGDILMGEDNYSGDHGVTFQHIRGMRPDGSIYTLARNPQVPPGGGTRPGAEFTGLCFSPDGKVLFANVQSPINTTFAFTGDWTGNR